MKVYDVFLFDNELDVLECRLVELGDQVDVFVIVEGTLSHQGAKREPTFPGQQPRFERWLPKMRCLVAELPEQPGSAPPWSRFRTGDDWERLRLQQDAGLDGLSDAEDGDIVIFSDVDEIPRRELVRLLDPGDDEILILEQRHHVYGFNWLYPEPWNGTGVARASTVRDKSLHRIRVDRPGARVIHDAGWHLSYFGGSTSIKRKVSTFTHPERTAFADAAEFCVMHGIAFDGVKLLPVRFDHNHPEQYPHYIRGGDWRPAWEPI